MIIHSFDRFGETRQFDPETGALTPAPRPDADVSPTHGHYTSLAGTTLVLYRNATTLLLRIGGTTTPVDDAHRFTYSQEGNHKTLRVTDRGSGEVVASLNYVLPKPIVAPEEDPTPFADPEDFDFGLFVANVANDSERRDRIYRDLDRPS